MHAAYLFDGCSSKAQAVWFVLEFGVIKVYAEPNQFTGFIRSEQISSLEISERWQGTSRKLVFPDGVYLEVENTAAFTELLQNHGVSDRSVARWQQSGWHAGVALAVILMCLGVGYVYGLPWMSKTLAYRMPDAWAVKMSEPVVTALESNVLRPSRLSADRTKRIEAGFLALWHQEDQVPKVRLLFRDSPTMGPNAFALPDGTVVVLDQLVSLADSDEEVFAVLAHELGHVYYKHGMRMVIQSSVVAALAGWALGDVSSLLSAASATLLQSHYSQDFEYEADGFGGHFLLRHQLSPSLLAGMLGKLDRAHQANKSASQNTESTEKSSEDAGVWGWLSSHPETVQRIQRLNALAERL